MILRSGKSPRGETAPNAAGLDPAVLERGTPMRTDGLGQSNTPELVAKEQQVFAEPRTGFGASEVISPDNPTGNQYFLSVSPAAVPGPTWVRNSFSA